MISTVHSLLTAKFLAALLLIGLFTKRYGGGHRSFDATRETLYYCKNFNGLFPSVTVRLDYIP